MAKPLRRPPGPAEADDLRARTEWEDGIHRLLRDCNEATVDVGSIAAGAKATFTITVPDAVKDKGQTVQVGLPANWNTDLDVYGYVSDNQEVTVVIRNPTGSPINPDSGVYGCRVMR